MVISDHGTQLVAAGGDINWAEIQFNTASKGTVWQFTPNGCPWRNGLAERSIGIAKKTLLTLINKHQTLNFAELETVYIRVASIMNHRPLTVRIYNEDDYTPISPSDLLLGRTSNLEHKVVTVWTGPHPDNINLEQKQTEITQMVDTWWKIWQRDSFSLFCPRRKWTTQERNLQIGDIVLLQYEEQVGKDKFRLGKITQVHPDKHNIVRTVTVSLRDLKKTRREGRNEAKVPQTTIVVGIQRLVVLLPVEEIWAKGLSSQ